jgi:hypothetical protein
MAYTDIDKSDEYFNTVTWTGTSDATTSVTGVNFQPDFVWIKNRNVADDNTLHDAIRGSTKTLFSNSTGAEGTNTESIQSFDSDGFTTGNHRGTGGNVGNLMVSWNWLASNTTASNTSGSITSTVSANTTSGFSIVSWTGNATAGATIGHGLGVAPSMLILKKTSASGTDWFVYHKSIGATHYLGLNENYDKQDQILAWNDTAPTSSVFSVGSGGSSNGSGASMITYCFAEKQGFSKFGSYTGNGNADGTFVYTGFKPSFVLVKRTDTVGYEWSIWDNKRDPFNLADTTLRSNTSETESTIGSFYQIDMLSQGYKFRTSNGDVNASDGIFIYMAFAENPFVTSTGIPTTAR